MRVELPFEQAVLARVGPATVLTPVRESAIRSETVVSVKVPAGIGRDWGGSLLNNSES